MKNYYILKMKLLLVTVFVLIGTGVFAQVLEVSGQVVDSEDNESLPGVTVVEKGTTNGTITDIDGNYTISIPESATLVLSLLFRNP